MAGDAWKAPSSSYSPSAEPYSEPVCCYNGCRSEATHDASAAPGRGLLLLCEPHWREFNWNKEGYMIGKEAEFEDLWLSLKAKEELRTKRRRALAKAREAAHDGDSDSDSSD